VSAAKLLWLLALMPALASSQDVPRDIEPECPVIVVYTLHTYDGPIVIEDGCLVSHEYGEGLLRIEAREWLGGGIFRDDFDPPQ